MSELWGTDQCRGGARDESKQGNGERRSHFIYTRIVGSAR